MNACGATPAAVADQNFDDNDYQGHQNIVLKFKTANVTSVLCLCIALTFFRLFAAATDQDFFPEWLGTSYGDVDANIWMKLFGGGRRWPIDAWPTAGDPFFAGACDGGAS